MLFASGCLPAYSVGCSPSLGQWKVLVVTHSDQVSSQYSPYAPRPALKVRGCTSNPQRRLSPQ